MSRALSRVKPPFKSSPIVFPHVEYWENRCTLLKNGIFSLILSIFSFVRNFFFPKKPIRRKAGKVFIKKLDTLEIKTTNLVAGGSSFPNWVYIFVIVGTTTFIITIIAKKPTTITMEGYINEFIIFDLKSFCFSINSDAERKILSNAPDISPALTISTRKSGKIPVFSKDSPTELPFCIYVFIERRESLSF
ncbi:MAG: DUF3899 domain-containing protein [Aquificota bacterium]|nr:MAG: DUF3899 domain-containing protein [Aquificota bacterium]